jgi:DNA repair exonuclease SbcCD ATPase subunit
MKKLSLQKLSFKAFRSFVEQQSIDLPPNGLVLINGHNNDSGSSSGSGKSSVHLAISYAFGYCPYYEKDLQSWLTEDEIQVELALTSNEGPIVIKRGRETSLQTPSFKKKGIVKLVNDAIVGLSGIPPDLLSILTYRQQRTRGAFLLLPNKEKREFLSKILNLEQIEPVIEKSIRRLNELDKYIDSQTTTIGVLTGQVSPVEDVQLRNSEAQVAKIEKLTVEKANLEYHKAIFSNEIREIGNIKKQINARIFGKVNESSKHPSILEISSLIDKKHAEIDNEIQLVEAQKLELKSKVEYHNRCIKASELSARNLSAHELNVKTLKHKISLLQAQKCSTCGQAWEDQKLLETTINDLGLAELYAVQSHKSQELIDENLSAKNIIQNQLMGFKSDKLDSLRNELKYFETQKQEKLRELSEGFLKEKELFLNKQRSDLQVVEQEDYDVISKLQPILQREQDIRNEVLRLEGEIASIERENKSLVDFRNRELKRNEGLSAKIRVESERLKRAQDEIAVESDLSDLLKGFLNSIFEEVLNEIADEANTMLRLIPNVQNVSMQFVTESLTLKNTVKQEPKAIFYKNGHQIPMDSGLSGGQFTSVELAMDLAVGEVIGRRMGVVPGWLILDEPFEGHSILEKEACLDFLKEVAKDRLVFVIDHSSEIKDSYFDKVIHVECQNDTSTIKDS